MERAAGERQAFGHRDVEAVSLKLQRAARVDGDGGSLRRAAQRVVVLDAQGPAAGLDFGVAGVVVGSLKDDEVGAARVGGFLDQFAGARELGADRAAAEIEFTRAFICAIAVVDGQAAFYGAAPILPATVRNPAPEQAHAPEGLVAAREVVGAVVFHHEDAVRVTARHEQPPGEDAGRARVEVFARVAQAHRAADVFGFARGGLARLGRAVRALYHIDIAREDRLNRAAPEVEFARAVRVAFPARGADGQHAPPGVTGNAVRIGGRNKTRVQAHAREGLVVCAHGECAVHGGRGGRAVLPVRGGCAGHPQLAHNQPAGRVDGVVLAYRQRAFLHPGEARVGVDARRIQREPAPAQFGQVAARAADDARDEDAARRARAEGRGGGDLQGVGQGRRTCAADQIDSPGQGQAACERGDVAGPARGSDHGHAGVVGGLGGQVDRPAPGVIPPARQQAAREREALVADGAAPGANDHAERIAGASRGRVPRVALQEQGRALVNDRARVRARGAERAVFADYQRALGHGGQAQVGIGAGARQQQVALADLGEAGGAHPGAADHARDRQAAGQLRCHGWRITSRDGLDGIQRLIPMTIDNAVGPQRNRAAPFIKAMQIAQCATVQRERLGHIKVGLRGNLVIQVAREPALQFQGPAGVYGRAARRAAQRVVVGDGECARFDRGQARVGVIAAQRELARARLGQIARAVDDPAIVAALHGQGLAARDVDLTFAIKRLEGLILADSELRARDIVQQDPGAAANGVAAGIGQHQFAIGDGGQARVGVRARKRGLAAAGLAQAARARADAPADGDFGGRAGSEVRRYCRG